MRRLIHNLFNNEAFFPTWIGIFINPFYFARAGLAKAMYRYSKHMGGRLLDVGCGSKPYEKLFNVKEYIGLDIDNENSRKCAISDYFYDGRKFPFSDQEFDSILCNQVLEHVFNPDEFLSEIYRVMKPGAKLLLTVPFVWDEHEQPFDYARYTSFGLKALLEKNKLKVIEYEKLGADASTLFQLGNVYLYKITVRWNKYVKLLFTILVLGGVNLLGICVRLMFPKNPDLFLDHILIAERSL